MVDPLCLLYYPFNRECYWWSIVLLLRPTVIAITFNARNRGTGLIQEIVDWRLLVCCGTLQLYYLEPVHMACHIM